MKKAIYDKLPNLAVDVIRRGTIPSLIEEAYESLASQMIEGNPQAFRCATSLFIVSDIIPLLIGKNMSCIVSVRLKNEAHEKMGVARLAREAYTNMLVSIEREKQ